MVILIHGVDGHDMFMGDRGRGTCFPAEPLPGRVVARELRIENFYGHVTLKMRVNAAHANVAMTANR